MSGHIFCSPLKRAVKTAEICSEGLGIPYTILECLIERDHGILEGHSYSDISLLAKSCRLAHGLVHVVEVEGGESYPELCERARSVLLQIERKATELKVKGHLLVVSHGAISRALEIVYKGLGPESMFDFPSFLNCEFKVLE